MKVAAGELAASDGSISMSGDVLYMPQDVGYDSEETIWELLLRFAPDRLRETGRQMVATQQQMESGDDTAGLEFAEAVTAWSELGGYQLEGRWDSSLQRILGLGIDDIQGRQASTLSGGEVKKLVLDVLFSSSATVLLLDEPDNYLDIPAKIQLEQQIRACRKTILLISHDRQLLCAATNKVVTLESSQAWVHGESYSTYVQARQHRIELLGNAVQQWKDEERRLYQYMKTMKERAKISPALAAQASAAETRWKRFVDAGAPPDPPTAQRVLVRFVGGESAQRALTGEDISVSGLINPSAVDIRAGERVAVIGPNGSGKSHLLRLLAGVSETATGRLTVGNRVSRGIFTQVNNRPDFSGIRVEAIVGGMTGNFEVSMKILARYGLQSQSRNSYDTLSGGQKARLEILVLELEGHNMLFLDEPTDNLDIDSSDALEKALETFEGTCISVSHDRAFLEKHDRFIYVDNTGLLYELLDYTHALNMIKDGNRHAMAKCLSQE